MAPASWRRRARTSSVPTARPRTLARVSRVMPNLVGPPGSSGWSAKPPSWERTRARAAGKEVSAMAAGSLGSQEHQGGGGERDRAGGDRDQSSASATAWIDENVPGLTVGMVAVPMRTQSAVAEPSATTAFAPPFDHWALVKEGL